MVKKEIKKYINARFIKFIDYSEWMANIILITKPTGEIRACANFRDINNACTKDEFTLSNIDIIINSIAGYDTLSFMDDFFGYIQILINPTDQHKITFTTPWGIFCWKVMMHFGLNNACATYHRAMVSMFHEHIHKIIELYMDDILVKSKQDQDHLLLLDEVSKF